MPENLKPKSDRDQTEPYERGQPAYNLFELRLEDGVAQGQTLSGGKIVLFSEIWVDGQHLDEPHPIDLPLLVQSLHVPGCYEIFTCNCGVAGCAGIVEGIEVTHDAGLVRWFFRRPQSVSTLNPPSFDAWEKTAKRITLTFDLAQMVHAVQTYLETVRALVGNDPGKGDWPVHGLSVQDVLKIDPNKPFYETEKGAS